MVMPITAKVLEEHGACYIQIEKFRECFGEGPAPINEETALKVAQQSQYCL